MLIEFMDHVKLMTAFELSFFFFFLVLILLIKDFLLLTKTKEWFYLKVLFQAPPTRERDEKEGKATSGYASCPTFFLPNKKHMRHILMFPVYL